MTLSPSTCGNISCRDIFSLFIFVSRSVLSAGDVRRCITVSFGGSTAASESFAFFDFFVVVDAFGLAPAYAISKSFAFLSSLWSLWLSPSSPIPSSHSASISSISAYSSSTASSPSSSSPSSSPAFALLLSDIFSNIFSIVLISFKASLTLISGI